MDKTPPRRAALPNRPPKDAPVAAPDGAISTLDGIKDAMRIDRIALGDLHQDAANARLHDAKNLRAIADSLKQFGQCEPLIVQKSTNKVIGGNGRLEAMRAMGWSHADVLLLDITDSKATALGIALNRTAELADWDLGVLDRLTKGLKDEDVDLASLGFEEGDLEEVARALELQEAQDEKDKEAEEDEAIEPPAEPKSRLGDIWQLGPHRLACGDSRDLGVVEALCAGEKMDMVLTDPPYGVNYKGNGKKKRKEIEGDSPGQLLSLLSDSLGNAYVACRDGACWYVWAPSGPLIMKFGEVLTKLGVWRQSIVWVKSQFVLGRGDYHSRHEHCFYGWKEGRHMTPPDRKQDTVWEAQMPRNCTEHPTMKPPPLFEKCIKNSSLRGWKVLDLFSGSGTTLLACEALGRVAYVCEIDPGYVDVAVARWEKATGDRAVLAPRQE